MRKAFSKQINLSDGSGFQRQDSLGQLRDDVMAPLGHFIALSFKALWESACVHTRTQAMYGIDSYAASSAHWVFSSFLFVSWFSLTWASAGNRSIFTKQLQRLRLLPKSFYSSFVWVSFSSQEKLFFAEPGLAVRQEHRPIW